MVLALGDTEMKEGQGIYSHQIEHTNCFNFVKHFSVFTGLPEFIALPVEGVRRARQIEIGSLVGHHPKTLARTLRAGEFSRALLSCLWLTKATREMPSLGQKRAFMNLFRKGKEISPSCYPGLH